MENQSDDDTAYILFMARHDPCMSHAAAFMRVRWNTMSHHGTTMIGHGLPWRVTTFP
jgi:hypothetical protein